MMKYLSDINWWKQFGLNVGGVLTAILGFLSILNIHYRWLNAGSINAFITLILALGVLFVGSFATIINTYLTERSKKKAKQVADDYTTQKLAEEQAVQNAEIEKVKAALAQLQAENASPVTTPSVQGPVVETNTTAN
jgi:hypothetical protein